MKYFDNLYNLKSLDWYKDQFPVVPKDQLIFEKSPSYFPTRGVAKRIYDTDPSVKLVLVVRDPVKR